MRLKIRSQAGAEVISLPDDANVSDLVAKIGPGEVRGGFPPKKLDLKNPEASLKSLGVANGDQLTTTGGAMSGGPTSGGSASPGGSKPVGSGSAAAVKNLKPSRSSASARSKSSNSDVPVVDLDPGTLTLRVMEDDNSCLFASIAYAVTGTVNSMFEMRTAVAEAIRADPVTYNDAILGKDRNEYIQWILRETSWGGAIELDILSKQFGVTIQCMDVSTGTMHSFNPGMATFLAVIYSGIHYDAVVLERPQGDQTVFNGDDTGFAVVEGLQTLRSELKKKHYYTDTATFQLKCNDCGTILTGEKQATQHAMKTGHSNFGEV